MSVPRKSTTRNASVICMSEQAAAPPPTFQHKKKQQKQGGGGLVGEEKEAAEAFYAEMGVVTTAAETHKQLRSFRCYVTREELDQALRYINFREKWQMSREQWCDLIFLLKEAEARRVGDEECVLFAALGGNLDGSGAVLIDDLMDVIAAFKLPRTTLENGIAAIQPLQVAAPAAASNKAQQKSVAVQKKEELTLEEFRALHRLLSETAEEQEAKNRERNESENNNSSGGESVFAVLRKNLLATKTSLSSKNLKKLQKMETGTGIDILRQATLIATTSDEDYDDDEELVGDQIVPKGMSTDQFEQVMCEQERSLLSRGNTADAKYLSTITKSRQGPPTAEELAEIKSSFRKRYIAMRLKKPKIPIFSPQRERVSLIERFDQREKKSSAMIAEIRSPSNGSLHPSSVVKRDSGGEFVEDGCRSSSPLLPPVLTVNTTASNCSEAGGSFAQQLLSPTSVTSGVAGSPVSATKPKSPIFATLEAQMSPTASSAAMALWTQTSSKTK